MGTISGCSDDPTLLKVGERIIEPVHVFEALYRQKYGKRHADWALKQ
jgi:hypothetical protein